jgi:hypothetical protein
MPTANSPASNEVVTAALLVIGGKILSGRTKDQNIGYIAEYLTALRVVGDDERAIVESMRCAIATPMSSLPAGLGRPTVTLPPTAWRGHSVCRSIPIRARSPSCTNG